MSRRDHRDSTAVKDVVQDSIQELDQHDLLFIDATGERLFGRRLLGSISESMARRAVTTLTRTKRNWRLKSILALIQERARFDR